MANVETMGNAPAVMKIQAVAIHDRRGEIRHMHHVIVLEGARPVDRASVTKDAVEQASRLGHDVSRLKALFVPELQSPGAMYRVDVKRGRLVELLPPGEKRGARARRVTRAC
jgi:hypothetical protein